MDVIEKATPNIIKHYLGTISQKERVSIFINNVICIVVLAG